jgi:hypothetical protein
VTLICTNDPMKTTNTSVVKIDVMPEIRKEHLRNRSLGQWSLTWDTHKSGIREDIIGIKRKHLTGYVKLEYIYIYMYVCVLVRDKD